MGEFDQLFGFELFVIQCTLVSSYFRLLNELSYTLPGTVFQSAINRRLQVNSKRALSALTKAISFFSVLI